MVGVGGGVSQANRKPRSKNTMREPVQLPVSELTLGSHILPAAFYVSTLALLPMCP